MCIQEQQEKMITNLSRVKTLGFEGQTLVTLEVDGRIYGCAFTHYGSNLISFSGSYGLIFLIKLYELCSEKDRTRD